MRLLTAATLVLFIASYSNADDKFELKSKDGRFTVTFPSKPMETTQEVPLKGSDEKIKVTNHVVEVDKKSAYIVAFNDYPAGVLAPNAQDVLKGVRDGNMGPEGKLGEEKTGTFGADKLPMREFTFTKNDLHFRNKLILDGTRLYQVMIVADSEKALTNDMAKAYYDSFSITKKKKK
jgi:hypothetical protein